MTAERQKHFDDADRRRLRALSERLGDLSTENVEDRRGEALPELVTIAFADVKENGPYAGRVEVVAARALGVRVRSLMEQGYVLLVKLLDGGWAPIDRMPPRRPENLLWYLGVLFGIEDPIWDGESTIR